MDFIEKIIFLLGWLKIVFSPLAIGVILGFLAYNYFVGILGIICGIGLPLIGLILGIIWAERIRKKIRQHEFPRESKWFTRIG